MKNLENKLIEIFCHIDDFNKVFINQLQTHQLTDRTRMQIKPCSLNESEVMTYRANTHDISSNQLLEDNEFVMYCNI